MLMVAGEKTVNHIIKLQFFQSASQTSWALMALHAAGEIRSENFTKGKLSSKNNHNFDEDYYTAVGFPKFLS